MNKFVIGVIVMPILLSVAAAQQRDEQQDRNPRQMMGMMRQKCPLAGFTMGSIEVKYEATATGASLIFTPKDPAKLNELQTKLREMAEHMTKGMETHVGHHEK